MNDIQQDSASFDADILLHLIVIDKRSQRVLLSIKYRSFDKDPEALAISYSPYEDYDGPLRTISKDEYIILIEGGGWPPIKSRTAVVLFVRMDNGRDLDEEAYRERMRAVLDLLEKGILDSTVLDKLPVPERNTASWLQVLMLHNLLSTQGLKWVGLVDTNPLDLMTRIWTEPSSPDRKQRIRDIVYSMVGSQIERGGTTIGLDVEKLIERDILAKYADRIRELREAEIESLQPIGMSIIPMDDYDITTVDLEPLWLSAYGFSVLSDLELGASCDGEDFVDVQDEFARLGIQLQTSMEAKGLNKPNISRAMEEYIRYISRRDVEGITPVQDYQLDAIVRAIMRRPFTEP